MFRVCAEMNNGESGSSLDSPVSPCDAERRDAPVSSSVPKIWDTLVSPSDTEIRDTPLSPSDAEITDTPVSLSEAEITDSPGSPSDTEIRDTPLSPFDAEIRGTLHIHKRFRVCAEMNNDENGSSSSLESPDIRDTLVSLSDAEIRDTPVSPEIRDTPISPELRDTPSSPSDAETSNDENSSPSDTPVCPSTPFISYTERALRYAVDSQNIPVDKLGWYGPPRGIFDSDGTDAREVSQGPNPKVQQHSLQQQGRDSTPWCRRRRREVSEIPQLDAKDNKEIPGQEQEEKETEIPQPDAEEVEAKED